MHETREALNSRLLLEDLEVITVSSGNKSYFSCSRPHQPQNSMDVGFSLASIQHLSATRPMMDDNLQRISNADKLLQEQAHKDLLQFLRHRGIETRPGGFLVLSLPSKSTSGPPDLVGPITSIFSALKLMFAEE